MSEGPRHPRRSRYFKAALCAAIACLVFLMVMRMSPPYPSQAVLVMQEGYRSMVTPDLQASLFGNLQEKSNLRMLRQLIYSFESAREVDESLGLRKYFLEQGNFYDQWLAAREGPSAVVSLVEHVAQVRIDDRAGLLVLETRAHDPQTAQSIGKALVNIAQRRLNDLAQVAAVEQIRFLEKEARRMADQDRDVQRRLMDFQDANGLTAAEIGIAAASAGGNGMEAEALLRWQQRLAELQVKRAALRQSLRDDTAEVQSLDAEIRSVEGQIHRRRGELLSRPGERPVGKARYEFANLLAEAQLSREVYLGAVRAIAQARADASRTLKRVDLVQAPTMPAGQDRGSLWLPLLIAAAAGLVVWRIVTVFERYVVAHHD